MRHGNVALENGPGCCSLVETAPSPAGMAGMRLADALVFVTFIFILVLKKIT